MLSNTYGLYAYGITREGMARQKLCGIDKIHAVFPVAERDLCVMVSKIDVDEFHNQVNALLAHTTNTSETIQIRAQALLQAHEDVVDALMEDATIVPFRFGTILKDEQAALKMLEEHEEKFKNLLLRFAGKMEWGLKIYADLQEFITGLQTEDSDFKRLAAQRANVSRGVAYLLAKKLEVDLKDNASARLTKVTEQIFQALGEVAHEARVEKTLSKSLTHKKKEMILNSAYLVEKTDVDTFCKQEKYLREKYKALRLDLELSGPWPPYSFIE